MAKIDSKDLLKRVQNKERPARANVTFRLNTELMEAFKVLCEDQGVTPTSVLEEFIATFVADLGKKNR